MDGLGGSRFHLHSLSKYDRIKREHLQINIQAAQKDGQEWALLPLDEFNRLFEAAEDVRELAQLGPAEPGEPSALRQATIDPMGIKGSARTGAEADCGGGVGVNLMMWRMTPKSLHGQDSSELFNELLRPVIVRAGLADL